VDIGYADVLRRKTKGGDQTVPPSRSSQLSPSPEVPMISALRSRSFRSAETCTAGTWRLDTWPSMPGLSPISRA
jgi:hypothetical protein